jgi:hypothetical protein
MGSVMISKLRNEIEEAAFMLANNENKKEIHSKLVKCLVLIDKLDSDSENALSKDDITIEINKVIRRLKMWAKPERQSQFNSKILNAYLEIKRSGIQNITEQNINDHLGLNTWFLANFNQMKIIADSNHGKIFDVDGNYVKIWEPIKLAVNNYENIIFNGR